MSVAVSTSPSGHAIKFQSHRPRGYFLMEDPTPARMLDDGEWGKRLDSVTSILGVLDKPALPWWGMEVGIEGVLQLVAQGELTLEQAFGQDPGYKYLITDPERELEIMGNEELMTDAKRIAKLLTAHKLTVNHVRDKAAVRGTTAHDAFETWCETGIIPEPSAYPDDQRHYVTALRKFFEENEILEPQTEVIVASPLHRFGGRYDIRGMMFMPKRGDTTHVNRMADVKTSKRVYSTHFLQMEGYEGASVELGYTPTEERIVIHLRPDGEYSLVAASDVAKDKQPCVYDDFLAILRARRVTNRLGGT